jgi:methylated-DNA-protein-cysteine methyltransferase-like protein
VRRVPRGRVASYDQIARIVGVGCDARMVGYAMAATPADNDLPWHRIVNRAGKISLRGEGGEIQRQLLEKEGVRFDAQGRINLERYGWCSSDSK